MSEAVLKIDLNLAGLWGKYFVNLQRLFDLSMFLKSGSTELRENQLAGLGTFMTFNLATESHLSFEEMRTAADQWLLKGFFREAVELTGLFLDECLVACAYIKAASEKKASAARVTELLTVYPKKVHKLHLPQKMERLSSDYGIKSPFETHVLSINRLRACVVHRLGVVSPMDVDDSKSLRVVWRATRLTARGEKSGNVIPLDRPGIHIPEESVVEFQFVDHERSFQLGESVVLSPEEIHACLVTFFQFGHSTAQLVEAYAKQLGLAVREAEKNV